MRTSITAGHSKMSVELYAPSCLAPFVQQL